MSSISVVITTYKRDKFLKKCIQSIIDQTFKDIEILIISDGFFEETEKTVNEFSDKRIKLFFNEHTGLPAASRNIGILKAKSKFITFCDDDDIWAENKLKEQYDLIIKNEIALIYTNVFLIDINDNHILSKKINFNTIYRFSKLNLFLTNYLTLSSIMLSTDLAKKHMFDENILLRGSEDYKFILQLINDVKFIFINKKLVGYRIHNENISSNKINGYNRSIMILSELSSKKTSFYNFFIKVGIMLYRMRINRLSIK